MAKVQVLDKSGKKLKEIEAPKDVVSYGVKDHLIYEAVINFRANQRRGTASTKTRGEVQGGGKKPWRQKGTGRARVGSIRSPIWKGGGTTFGPRPRDFSFSMPKKARKNALKSVLSSKLSEKQVLVLDSLKFEEAKTSAAVKMLRALNVDNALIVDSQDNTNLFLSVRNIPSFKAVDHKHVNIYDVLHHKWLIFSEEAFGSFMERLK